MKDNVQGVSPRARTLSGKFWHQGPPRFPVVSASHPATTSGRFHDRGDDGVWYASSTEQGAWAEFFRHWTNDEVDPFQVRRRIGVVEVSGLRVLDVSDRRVRDEIRVDMDSLVGDDYTVTRQLARSVRNLDGVLCPAAGLRSGRTLAVFAHAWHMCHEISSTIRVAPPKIIRKLDYIVLRPEVPEVLQRTYREASLNASVMTNRLRGRRYN